MNDRRADPRAHALLDARDRAAIVSDPSSARAIPTSALDADVAIDEKNGLASVGAAIPLDALCATLVERGYHAPLLDPVPALPLLHALAVLAPVTDALLASATLVTIDGITLSTPDAPRSATGPDLLGLALIDPPLAVVVKARLRVFSRTHVEHRLERYPSEEAAAARVRALFDDGRAFLVEAAGRVVRVVGACRPDGERVEHATFPAFASAASTLPAVGALSAALVDGARVFAAPAQGRVGVLELTRVERAWARPTDVVAHWRRPVLGETP